MLTKPFSFTAKGSISGQRVAQSKRSVSCFFFWIRYLFCSLTRSLSLSRKNRAFSSIFSFPFLVKGEWKQKGEKMTRSSVLLFGRARYQSRRALRFWSLSSAQKNARGEREWIIWIKVCISPTRISFILSLSLGERRRSKTKREKNGSPGRPRRSFCARTHR